MKHIVICPGDRPAVAFLAQSGPLVNLPMLSQAFIAYWMEWLADRAATDVLVLATDRPEQVRELLQTGQRWGLRITVQPELVELSPDEARQRYAPAGWDCPATLIDHLPEMPSLPLFSSYRCWFTAVQAWLPCAAGVNRIGFRQIIPCVWTGRHAQVHHKAKILAPCWIGENVQIGPNTIIGPRVVLDNGVIVESAAEIADSVIGPDTFVGALTRVKHSLAWGNTLIDWRTGSCVQVPDAFLLSSLSQRSAMNGAVGPSSWTPGWSFAIARAWRYLTRRKPTLQHR